MSALQEGKLWVMAAVDLPKDALHIYVGLALFLGSAALFRWRLSDARPWLVALAGAVAGEIWDLYDTLSIGARVRPGGHWHDIWNTLFWPTALLILARLRRLRA